MNNILLFEMYGVNSMKMDLKPANKAMRSTEILLSLNSLSKVVFNKVGPMD